MICSAYNKHLDICTVNPHQIASFYVTHFCAPSWEAEQLCYTVIKCSCNNIPQDYTAI
jgi:hypothetical protein